MADNVDYLNRLKIIDNQTIALSTTFTSDIVPIVGQKLLGSVTLQIILTGDGTGKFQFSQSNNYLKETDTGDFIIPSSASDIVTAFTKASGTDTDGKDIINIPMFNAQAFKILCTETVGANSITVDAWLSMQ